MVRTVERRARLRRMATKKPDGFTASGAPELKVLGHDQFESNVPTQPFGPDLPSSGVILLPELLITRQRCGEGTAARRQVCYREIAGSQ